MTHKFRKGDKVGVFIHNFGAYVPAKVVHVSKNLIDAKLNSQTLAFFDNDVTMIKPAPRPKRKIYRVSERLKP